ELELTLARAIFHRPALLHDRQVRLEKMIADALRGAECAGEVADGPVVEEQPADAARLGAMRQVEIFVAPFLEERIGVARGLARGLVPVARVVLEAIARR